MSQETTDREGRVPNQNGRYHWLIKHGWTILIAAALLFCVSYIAIFRYRSMQRHDFYENAEIGSDFSEFIGDADGIVQIEDFRVVYFWGIRLESKTKVLPKRVERCEQLPFVYDAIQCMVNADGVLLAKAWCGEGTNVITIAGPFPGSCMGDLKAIPAMPQSP